MVYTNTDFTGEKKLSHMKLWTVLPITYPILVG